MADSDIATEQEVPAYTEGAIDENAEDQSEAEEQTPKEIIGKHLWLFTFCLNSVYTQSKKRKKNTRKLIDLNIECTPFVICGRLSWIQNTTNFVADQ